MASSQSANELPMFLAIALAFIVLLALIFVLLPLLIPLIAMRKRWWELFAQFQSQSEARRHDGSIE